MLALQLSAYVCAFYSVLLPPFDVKHMQTAATQPKNHVGFPHTAVCDLGSFPRALIGAGETNLVIYADLTV